MDDIKLVMADESIQPIRTAQLANHSICVFIEFSDNKIICLCKIFHLG